jgi:hypothetical protein
MTPVVLSFEWISPVTRVSSDQQKSRSLIGSRPCGRSPRDSGVADRSFFGPAVPFSTDWNLSYKLRANSEESRTAAKTGVFTDSRPALRLPLCRAKLQSSASLQIYCAAQADVNAP